MGLNFQTPNTASWYNLAKEPFFVTNTRIDDDIFSLLIFLSPDRQMYKRSIYSILDWIGDIGGLFDGLQFIGSLFMGCYYLLRVSDLNAYLFRSVYMRETKLIGVTGNDTDVSDKLTDIKKR